MLVSEFEDDLATISSCSDENDLSQLCHYLTVGRGHHILQVLAITGVTVRCSLHTPSTLPVTKMSVMYRRFSLPFINNVQDFFPV